MSLESLVFDNEPLRDLPVAPDSPHRNQPENAGRAARLVGACFARYTPSAVADPVLALVSEPALRLLGLDAAQAARPEFLAACVGAALLPGSQPAARSVAAHQFFMFAGGTGDAGSCYLGTVRVSPVLAASSDAVTSYDVRGHCICTMAGGPVCLASHVCQLAAVMPSDAPCKLRPQ